MHAPFKPDPGRPLLTDPASQDERQASALQPEARPAKLPLPMRRYHVASLRETGSVRYSEHIGPATPLFEAAFCAFAHGTLISTPRGQIAVEDLEPGMRVATQGHGAQEVVWAGSMTLVPHGALTAQGRSHGAPKADFRSGSLTRVTAHSFGFARPSRDLLAGPGARLLQRDGAARPCLAPASSLVDGVNAIEVIPPRPVTVHHIGLRTHALITANGLCSESFHPGPGFEQHLSSGLLSLFLSLFPHISTPADFGPLSHPQLPLAAGGRAQVA